jgi:hypothetical protein
MQYACICLPHAILFGLMGNMMMMMAVIIIRHVFLMLFPGHFKANLQSS